MADSLKDQLLKAGFNAPAPAPRKPGPRKPAPRKPGTRKPGRRSLATRSAATPDVDAVAQRRELKARIKALIEADRLHPFAGEHAYAYRQGVRIRQLFVNDEARRRLADGELLITRFNGVTQLIPRAAGIAIRALNPDWVLIDPAAHTGDDTADSDPAYADYTVPDDLRW